jgi:hypothetical protein
LHSCDPPHFTGKLALHAHHLPQPRSIGYLYMNQTVCKSDNGPPLRQRFATGHRPGSRQLVLSLQPA